jgi:hypothetical protein
MDFAILTPPMVRSAEDHICRAQDGRPKGLHPGQILICAITCALNAKSAFEWLGTVYLTPLEDFVHSPEVLFEKTCNYTPSTFWGERVSECQGHNRKTPCDECSKPYCSKRDHCAACKKEDTKAFLRRLAPRRCIFNVFRVHTFAPVLAEVVLYGGGPWTEVRAGPWLKDHVTQIAAHEIVLLPSKIHGLRADMGLCPDYTVDFSPSSKTERCPEDGPVLARYRAMWPELPGFLTVLRKTPALMALLWATITDDSVGRDTARIGRIVSLFWYVIDPRYRLYVRLNPENTKIEDAFIIMTYVFKNIQADLQVKLAFLPGTLSIQECRETIDPALATFAAAIRAAIAPIPLQHTLLNPVRVPRTLFQFADDKGEVKLENVSSTGQTNYRSKWKATAYAFGKACKTQPE